MPSIDGNRRRGRPFLLLAVPLAALAAAALHSYTRSPYERFVSPPLDKRETRISLLIPRGWKPKCVHRVPSGATTTSFEFEPGQPFSWLPRFVRTWMHIQPEDGHLEVFWEYSPTAYRTNFEMLPPQYRDGRYVAYRSRALPGIGSWLVSYDNGDEGAIEATYRAILDSVSVK